MHWIEISWIRCIFGILILYNFMSTHFPPQKTWSGVPPWVLIGAVAVLLPIFAFMTVQNIHREKEFTTCQLLEFARPVPIVARTADIPQLLADSLKLLTGSKG